MVGLGLLVQVLRPERLPEAPHLVGLAALPLAVLLLQVHPELQREHLVCLEDPHPLDRLECPRALLVALPVRLPSLAVLLLQAPLAALLECLLLEGPWDHLHLLAEAPQVQDLLLEDHLKVAMDLLLLQGDRLDLVWLARHQADLALLEAHRVVLVLLGLEWLQGHLEQVPAAQVHLEVLLPEDLLLVRHLLVLAALLVLLQAVQVQEVHREALLPVVALQLLLLEVVHLLVPLAEARQVLPLA